MDIIMENNEYDEHLVQPTKASKTFTYKIIVDIALVALLIGSFLGGALYQKISPFYQNYL